MPTPGKVRNDPSLLPEGPSRGATAFREDESGQLLILTGVLLVMGFVVVGSTLVQVQTLEESTARLARESILVPFDDLLIKFNQTLRDSVTIGETNVTVFKNTAEHSSDRLRESAIGRGLYLSAEPVKDPSTSLFWRDARCGAFKEVQDGFVLAYHAETREESIVGAVYEIYATNGDQTMKTQYYVKFYDCLPSTTVTFVDSYIATPNTKGPPETVVDFVNAKSETDGGAAANLTEQVQLDAPSPGTALADPPTTNVAGWENKNSIKFSDGDIAYKAPGTTAADHFKFNMEVASFPPGDIYTNLVIHLDGWYYEDPVSLYVDDHFDIYATYKGQTIGPFAIQPSNIDPPTPPTVSIPTNPWGNLTWTRAELAATEWDIKIDEGAAADSGIGFRIDRVSLTLEYYPAWQTITADLMFDYIPPIFDTHTMEMRYQMTQHPEEFTFQVWDGTAWNTRDVQVWDGATWTTHAFIPAPPANTWRTLQYTATEAEVNGLPDHEPKFRLIDRDNNDFVAPTSVEIDYLKITSVFTTP
ncbi:MAG: hypothetical protein KY455_05895 [Euryarchaeota archaeon]|nr:hypothetical protein [Euryarchaeota archaeon]